MPLGPYKKWSDCVRAQRRKGKSKDSAAKICGTIESNTRKAKGK
jgi:hypothetical protein